MDGDRGCRRRAGCGPARRHGPGANARRPGDTRPIRWQVPPDLPAASRSDRVSAGAWAMRAVGDRRRRCAAGPASPRGRRRYSGGRPRSCPSARPAGRHRGRRCAGRHAGSSPRAGRNVGVFAWRTALSAASSRQPQPSRMTSMTGLALQLRHPSASETTSPVRSAAADRGQAFRGVLRACGRARGRRRRRSACRPTAGCADAAACREQSARAAGEQRPAAVQHSREHQERCAEQGDLRPSGRSMLTNCGKNAP